MKRLVYFTGFLTFLALHFGVAQSREVTFTQSQLASDPSLTEFPTDLEVIDLDGDGDEDFVGASSSSHAILWFENLGNSTYESRIVAQDDEHTFEVVRLSVGDIDGDGDIDIVSFNEDESIHLFENEGQATFTLERVFQDPNVINQISEISIGDVDNDEDLDILVAGDKLLLLRNNEGSFSPEVIEEELSCRFSSALIADINDDLQLDLVASLGTTCPPEEAQIILFVNRGDEFEKMIVLDSVIGNSAGGWQDLNFADIDGDDRTDIIALEKFGRVEWLRQHADGTFTRNDIYDLFNGQNWDCSIIDIHDDGIPDVSVVRPNDDDVILMQNDGVGNFSEFRRLGSDTLETPLGAKPFTNSDGDLNFVIANSGANNYMLALDNGSYSYSFEELFRSESDYNALIDFLLRDVNGDGEVDVVAATNKHVIYSLNDGSEGFDQRTIIPQDSLSAIKALDLGDLNNDGVLDLVIVGSDLQSSEALVWIKQDLTQEVLATVDGNPGGCALLLCKSDVQIVDLNDDGFNDILFAASDNDQILYLENQQNETFQVQTIDSEANDASVILGYDFDEDGDLDILSTLEDASRTNHLSIYSNDGDDGFTKSLLPLSGNPIFDIVPANIDGNGGTEIVFNLWGRGIWYWSGSLADDPIALPEVNQTDINTTLIDKFEIVDLDKDDDLDIVVAIGSANRFGWYENADFVFHFHELANDFRVDVPVEVLVQDLDGNDTVDIVGINWSSDNIVRFEPSILEIIPPLGFESSVQFRPFPNPFSNSITLGAEFVGKIDYRLVDLQGRVIMEGNKVDVTQPISIPALPFGLYLLEIDYGGSLTTLKVLKTGNHY